MPAPGKKQRKRRRDEKPEVTAQPSLPADYLWGGNYQRRRCKSLDEIEGAGRVAMRGLLIDLW